MLIFVGLGLNEEGISVEGLKEARGADWVYGEFKTGLLPGYDLGRYEQEIGGPIEEIREEEIEEGSEELFERSEEGKVVLLVPGDPMVGTSYNKLRLEAGKRGIKTRIVHGPSAVTAVSGEAGLYYHKFGRSVFLSMPDEAYFILAGSHMAPYEVLERNGGLGLHTLFLLDMDPENDRYLTPDDAVGYLLTLEDSVGADAFSMDTLAIAVSRAGTSDASIKGHRAREIMNMDFGDPPHSLIVPGRLDREEARSLERFADVPVEVLKEKIGEFGAHTPV